MSYKLTPVNGAVIADIISEEEYLKEVLGIDPKAPVMTAGGIHLVTDQDNDPSSMIVYAKATVTDIDSGTPPNFPLKIGDVIIYNIGAVVYRDRATAKKKVMVQYPNIIVVYSKEN